MTEGQRQAVWGALQRITRPQAVHVVVDYTTPRTTLAGRLGDPPGRTRAGSG
jgi:hypothetical protein